MVIFNKYLAKLILTGFAGTCNSIFSIVIFVIYILCDITSIYLQNIYIYSRRFLTYFFPENIGSSPVDPLSMDGTNVGVLEEPH